MPKIKDIIEVPPVKTVIELSTVRDSEGETPEELNQLLDTFVITDDIERNLKIILDRISNYPYQGMGFFLTGNFGSGKSHFLSVISLLLQYPWAWEHVVSQSEAIQQYGDNIKERRYLVVQIPLLEYRKTDSLEDIFWKSIEETMASSKYRIFAPLAQSSYFLEQFEKYIIPAHSRELNKFIQGKLSSKYTWGTIRQESVEDAILFAQEFLKLNATNIPFRLTLERQKTWNRLMVIMKQNELSGLVVLMDELSEFLKSKPDNKALNEDTRFLQFIGEKSTHAPVWIVGALQEAIERTGDISQVTFNKIKDRYQRNLELSTRHIRELIDRRLIRKKGAESISVIKEAYGILKSGFSHLKISEDDFLQIYPVHPETLELLDVNTNFFSQRRGVVDFIHYQVKGDPIRQIQGMMDDEYTQLLTPDKIFDHFSFRIREMVDISQYYQIYRDYFEKRILRIFDDKTDQEYALKLVKILILLKVSPVSETRTVRQLADMVLYNCTDLGGDLNYEYIQEQILGTLRTKASYIKVNQGDDPLSDVYYIDLESKTTDIIEHKKRDILLSLTESDQRVLDTAFDQLVYGPLPLAHLRGIYSERKNISWENTPRSGMAKLQNLTEISESEIEDTIQRLRTSEDDFVLYLGIPFDIAKQREHFRNILNSYNERFINGLVYWLPEEINNTEKIQILKDFYAQHEIFAEYSSDGSKSGIELRENLKRSMEEMVLQVRDVIEGAYFSGKVYTTQGEITGLELTDSKTQNFNTTLARIIREPIRTLYPDHISPQVEISTRRLISDLIDDFVRPGRTDDITAPHARYLRTSIEGIAVPLGLARKRDNGYDLDVDVNKNPLLARIAEIIPQAENTGSNSGSNLVEYKWVYQQLRKSEYGIIGPVFELFIASLMRKGQLIGYKGGIPVNISQVGFPLSNYVQQIGQGQLINGDLRWQLASVSEALLGEKLQDYDVTKQEEIWARLCDLREKTIRGIANIRQELEVLHDRMPSVDISNIMESLNRLQSLIAEIRPNLSSKEGLEHFLKIIPTKLSPNDDISNLMKHLKAVKVFIDEQAQNLLAIRNYILSPQLVIPERKEYLELRSLKSKVEMLMKVDEKFIFGDGMDKLQGAFKRFKDAFTARYAQEHKSINDSVDSYNLEQIKNSDIYQILSQFSKISMVSVPNDMVKIGKLIDNESRRSCNRAVHEELSQFPICQCGFKLGTEHKSISGSNLAEMVESGIRQYVSSLQEPPYGEQIEDYMTKMQQLDQKIPQKELTGMLRLDPELPIDDLKDELARVLTPTAIQHINRALEGDIVIVKRNISELYQDLIDRKYPKAKVREIINRWMDGDQHLPDDVYIMIEEE
ncbi:hypothetical protein GF312_14270 [Candidatus Poribacteria bacterium]|nr:hypothetical protein [Candidatus Poribacteria bacterium]